MEREFPLEFRMAKLHVATIGAAIGIGVSNLLYPLKLSDPHNPECPDTNVRVSRNLERSKVEVRQDQILNLEQLEKLNIKIFDFSNFQGKIEFTTELLSFIQPITDRQAKVRIIFVDDVPNEYEFKKFPFKKDLASLTDEEISQYKDALNVKHPHRITSSLDSPSPKTTSDGDCVLQSVYIDVSPTYTDSQGYATARYDPKRISVTNPVIEFTPTITLLIATKDTNYGYGALTSSFYKTIPNLNLGNATLVETILHELQHANDYAKYRNQTDPNYVSDFKRELLHDERPGEQRAILTARSIIYQTSNGKLPPIIIRNPEGKILMDYQLANTLPSFG